MLADTTGPRGTAAAGERSRRRVLPLVLAVASLAVLGLVLTAGGAGAQEESPAADSVLWDDTVVTVLAGCTGCHPDLADYDGALVWVTPGDAEGSTIYQVQAAGGHPVQLSDADLALLAAWIDQGALQSEGGAPPGGEEPAADPAFNNEVCLGCHGAEGLTTTLPSGEVLPLTFDVEAHEASVHGPYDIPCILCHTNITIPHEPLDPEQVPDLRAWTLQRNEACADCHEQTATIAKDNVHADALAEGHREAAVCTDCHGAHDTQRPVAHTPEVALTCRECHSQIYGVYEESVHGAALIHGIRDVPTCTDCHGVHDVEGPSKPQFHLFSPEICAKCHEDEELMGKYGISTDVFDTYVADFHGTTVVLFEELAPDQETNKPVCIDCHGVHSIQSADDPESSTFRENLLGTCQRCHPDATANFPASWLSHYTPSPDTATVVWIVTMFYKIIIPLVIGAMLAYVLLFSFRRWRQSRGTGHA